MRAAFCTGPGRMEVREVSAPEPSADDVLVRVHACGICGSDLHYFNGAEPPPPFCLGHEISGRIAIAADGFAAGERVVVEPLISCGACPRCRAGEPNLCRSVRVLGSMAPGGFAEAVAVPRGSLYHVPEAVDLDLAMLTEPLAVGVHAVRLAAVEPGAEVLILGAGVIGLLTAFAAVQAGGRVRVSARYPHQRSAALSLGADAVLETDRAAIRAAASERPPDVVLETVGGRADTLDLALQAVRPGGRIVALGKFTEPITLHPLRFLMKEAHLVSSMTYSRTGTRPDFAVALGLLAAFPSRFEPLITHRVSLAEIGHGFAIAANKTSGAIKVAVDCTA